MPTRPVPDKEAWCHTQELWGKRRFKRGSEGWKAHPGEQGDHSRERMEDPGRGRQLSPSLGTCSCHTRSRGRGERGGHWLRGHRDLGTWGPLSGSLVGCLLVAGGSCKMAKGAYLQGGSQTAMMYECVEPPKTPGNIYIFKIGCSLPQIIFYLFRFQTVEEKGKALSSRKTGLCRCRTARHSLPSPPPLQCPHSFCPFRTACSLLRLGALHHSPRPGFLLLLF